MSDKITHTTKRQHGLPTKYTEDMPGRLLDYFNCDPDDYLVVTSMDSGRTDYRILAKNLPTLVKFARMVGVNRMTLYDWQKAHPEFAEAMAEAKSLQEEAIVNIGISTNGQFTNFMLKCNHGWRDNDDLNVGTGDTGEVTVVFKRGKSQAEREAEEADAGSEEE